MKTFHFTHAIRAAPVVTAFAGASTAAMADINDYRFELVSETIPAGPDQVITVRLVNTKPANRCRTPLSLRRASTWLPTPCRKWRRRSRRCRAPSRAPTIQGDLRHGRPLAAFARRQGSG